MTEINQPNNSSFTEQPTKPTPPKAKNELLIFGWEFIKALLILGSLAVLFRVFIFQPFIVDGSSMEPTYHNSDYLLVDKLTYRFRDPKRGEVIVFHYPRNPAETYIKRIIGLPGETVKIAGGHVAVFNSDEPNGRLLHESYLLSDDETQSLTDQSTEEYTLGGSEYYVLGDNRTASSDSRVFGPVNRSLVIGRSMIRLFPINDISFFWRGPSPAFAELSGELKTTFGSPATN